MFKATLTVIVIALGLTFAAEQTSTMDKKELELRALTTLTGSERKAKRMRRTIERYRVWRNRVDEKIANGVDENKALQDGGFSRLMAMSNAVNSLPANNQKVLWQLVHGTLDLELLITSPQGTDTTSSAHEQPYIEEMVVVGSIFDHMSMDPADFSVDDIKTMRGERRYANQLYREENYDDAYPILLDLARRGFKDAQSRLAYILFNGTPMIEKSNLRALVWLGTSAYGDSEPQFRVLFKKYLDEVPSHVRPTVDKIVRDYQHSFAHDEHQNCSTEHYYAHGRVKRTYCRFKLEAIAEACERGSGGGKCWAHAVNARLE